MHVGIIISCIYITRCNTKVELHQELQLSCPWIVCTRWVYL